MMINTPSCPCCYESFLCQEPSLRVALLGTNPRPCLERKDDRIYTCPPCISPGSVIFFLKQAKSRTSRATVSIFVSVAINLSTAPKAVPPRPTYILRSTTVYVRRHPNFSFSGFICYHVDRTLEVIGGVLNQFDIAGRQTK